VKEKIDFYRGEPRHHRDSQSFFNLQVQFHEKMKTTALFLLFLNLSLHLSYSQTIESPNYSLKSHQTLEIKKIITDSKSSRFYMSIENRREGGTFCADRNIYIIYPDGKRSKMVSSSGIPNCPDNYIFKTVGEHLDFVLSFPPVKSGTQWIDLVEDCNDNCFSFLGIALKQDLNIKINEAFTKSENLKPEEAMKYFIDILDSTDNQNLGSEGLLYINIITLAVKAGDTVKAEQWYNRLRVSGAPHLSRFISFLNDKGIKY
jgi:hypothetical protein